MTLPQRPAGVLGRRARVVLPTVLALAMGAVPAGAWTPPRVVVTRGEVVAPALAGGDRDAAVVWWGRDGDGTAGVRAAAVGPGSSRGAVVAVPSPRVAAPAAVTLAGVPWAVWNDADAGGPRVVAAPAESPGDAAAPGTPAAVPGVVVAAAAEGDALAVATARGGAVLLTVRLPGAGGWTAPVAGRGTPGAPVRVAVAGDGTAAMASGRVVVVRRPGGAVRRWGYPRAPGWSRVDWDVAAAPGGGATAGWNERRGGRVRPATAVLGATGGRVRRWRGAGIGLGTGVTVSPVPGGAALVWADQGGVHRVRRRAGAGWGPVTTLAPVRCANATPVGEVTAGTGTVVVWTDDGGLLATALGVRDVPGPVVPLAAGQRSLTWAAVAPLAGGAVVAWRHAPRARPEGEATEVVSAVTSGADGLETAAPGVRRRAPAVRLTGARRVPGGLRVSLAAAAPAPVAVLAGGDAPGGVRVVRVAPGRRAVTVTGPAARGARYVTAYDMRAPACPLAVPVGR